MSRSVMDLPATGGCRCDRLRFEVTAPPVLTAVCHCRGCQRMTGGPFSLSIAIPTQGFRVTQGQDGPGGADHEFGHRFCPHCLSWVFTRPPGLEAFANVRATMLDDVPPEPPFVETCTAEALPWLITGARHSFAAFPEMERWATWSRPSPHRRQDHSGRAIAAQEQLGALHRRRARSAGRERSIPR